jgi:hypothetical protein
MQNSLRFQQVILFGYKLNFQMKESMLIFPIENDHPQRCF